MFRGEIESSTITHDHTPENTPYFVGKVPRDHHEIVGIIQADGTKIEGVITPDGTYYKFPVKHIQWPVNVLILNGSSDPTKIVITEQDFYDVQDLVTKRRQENFTPSSLVQQFAELQEDGY